MGRDYLDVLRVTRKLPPQEAYINLRYKENYPQKDGKDNKKEKEEETENVPLEHDDGIGRNIDIRV